MHEVDKMDTEGNSKERKLESCKEEGFGGGGVNEGRKDHGFGLGDDLRWW